MQLSENNAAILPWVIRGKIVESKTYRDEAVAWMTNNRAPAAAIRIIKAGVPASKLSPDWTTGIRAFIETAATASAFLRLVSDRAFQVVPLRQRNLITTDPGTAVMVGESVAKPLTPIEWQTVVLEPVVKAIATTAFSNELWLRIDADGQAYMHRQLVKAVSKAIDSIWLDLITSTGTPSAASYGPTAADAWKDLRSAAAVVNASGVARAYWVLSPSAANRAAGLDASGIGVFPAMSGTGGELMNWPALVSAGVADGQAYLIDADRILAGADAIVPRETQEADLLMSTTPAMDSATPRSAQMTSTWQTDSTGVICEAVFAARALFDSAVYAITGINWGG
jgi:hypothetical protein